ncbi:DUF3298 and DUF4163 domain-containing protein [Paenibacillus tarimensis]|uniref:DUF3298 and DUF4163 domain-containing protein n=1 Tax=Paenibacillus tarimensis TaxID=416012 RepID=UPI001F45CB25|nr:DUF3298 and DUF4163 domain-containing protein [Paenibacillus tarimensis]MCF2945126.1 DUF3298 and DUF4163 domain-containing protein [Paenibacillus tarimensis]
MATFQLPAGIHPQLWSAPGVTIYYPHVYGLTNRYAEQQINRTILHTLALIQQEQAVNQPGHGMGTEVTGHFEIKTNERGILSLMLTNYTFSPPAAHGYTIARSLTFDTQTGRLYTLQDLFKPESDYVRVLSAEVAAQIKQRDIPVLQEFTSIRPDQDYYLADKALVIYFPLYEITPYAAGFPMFPISVYVLLPIAAEQGPLDTLAADIA